MFDRETEALLKIREGTQELTAAHLKIREGTSEFSKESARLFAEAGRNYSITRVIDCASRPDAGLTNGPEFEVSQELARRVGLHHDLHRPFIPWWALQSRTVMNTGTASQGGNLVGLDTSHTAPALFAASTVVRLGAQVIQVTTDIQYPKIAANGTAAWVAEAGTAAPAEPTLSAIAVGMRTVVAPATFTRQLLLQTSSQQFIPNHLLGLVGAEIDRAFIWGTGGTQPTGIINTASIGTAITGTGFTHANAQGLVRVAATANVPDENIRFLSTPAFRETLSQRATGTGNEARFIWQQDNIADKPAYVSTNCLAGAIVCGDFTTLHLLTWTGGIQLAFNPYHAPMSDIVAMKAVAYVDAVVTQPACFAVGTGCT